jgi:hypothetical protein
LFFKEWATLTIVPGKDIPIKQQIIFGYEGDGKDYHLAVVDPKSKEIKIKLLHFSGAGVGSGGDSAWAANLMIQAADAQTRISQKLGEFLQVERRVQVLGLVPEDDTPIGERIESALDQFEDQSVQKEIVAAELDCQHGTRAFQDLNSLERSRQLLGLPPTSGLGEKFAKLVKIIEGCKKAYNVSGTSNGVSFSGKICGLDRPFTIDATFPSGTAKTTFKPDSVVGGTTSVTGGGNGCVQSGGGKYTVTINQDGSGSITWTTTDTLTCSGFSASRTGTFTLPLQPAPEISCP